MSAINTETIKRLLKDQCGYKPHLMKENYAFSSMSKEKRAALVAFAHEPMDARSSCIAFNEAEHDIAGQVRSYRELGAPIVLIRQNGSLQWWNQKSDAPVRQEEVSIASLEKFFKSHKDFSPESIYRAKTKGRLSKSFQLKFVDFGLMPLVEEEIGQELTRLVVRIFPDLKDGLGWEQPNALQGRWLIQSTFWILAAKILHDKQVPNFKTIDLLDPDTVFNRVAKHYGSRNPPLIKTSWRQPLIRLAEQVERYAPLSHVTTEALAEVYENALITKENRKRFGIHSTPSFLVDYMVWQMEPWIKEIPFDDRVIFEPACGHAAFLVSAMRLLRELAPENTSHSELGNYLRQHLFGIEIDEFALEIARLSLTLADIPNPNGWRLEQGDMFSGDRLEQLSRNCRIFFSNAPFENFTTEEKWAMPNREKGGYLRNKTAEMLRRALPELPAGALIGIVVPQGFLNSKDASKVRKLLVEGFEIKEISLLPDKVFKLSDMESAIILARRLKSTGSKGIEIICRHVREKGLQDFRNYFKSDKILTMQARFAQSNNYDLRVPELEHIWSWLNDNQRMDDIAEIGQGLSFKKKGVATSGTTISDRPIEGFRKGFAKIGKDLQLHGKPQESWLNLDPKVLMSPRKGTAIGLPQVLMNHARVSRGSWRIKAFIDGDGHTFTTNYNALRPKSKDIPLEYLWALINSPLANAFAYSHSMKRHILAGTVKSIPIPRADSTDRELIAGLVTKYVTLASSHDTNKLKDSENILLRIDAEVLRLYDLPPKMERELLDLFSGEKRPGVISFPNRYFPADLESYFHLHEYLSDEFGKSTSGKLIEKQTEEVPAAILSALKKASEAF
ncbi:MAG TPA: N-6 DNA methylase [bacterium]|nr:N-6 DNA methylase [bacterium]